MTVCRLAARLALAVVALVALPAGSQAATLTFANPTHLFPTERAGSSGPANLYPSSIPVSDVPGTVTDVNVTLLGMATSDDGDIVLRGPNGQQVMLLSDACMGDTTQEGNWTFDDSAQGFVTKAGTCNPNGPTPAIFLPTNYLGQPDGLDNSTEPDDLSASPGGPPPPYVKTLAALAGGSPNGSWDLFVLDDNSACCLGVELNSGWALTLEIAPAVPSNQFTIGALNGRSLSIDVPAAGTVSIDDAGSKDRLKPTQTAGGPGTVQVKVKLTKPAKRIAKRKGKVKAEVAVTFAPTGGTAATQTSKLKVPG